MSPSQWNETPDVVGPQRVVARDEDVDPDDLTGNEEHRPSPTAAAGQLDVRPAERGAVDVVLRLAAAEDERGPVDVEHPDRAAQRLGPVPVVQLTRRAP